MSRHPVASPSASSPPTDLPTVQARAGAMLTARLDRLRQRLRWSLAMAGLALPAVVFLLWLGLSLAGDYLAEPGRLVRAVMLIVGVTGLLVALIEGVVRPARRGLSDDDLAVIVERYWPALDSRLISAVQFARVSDEQARQANMSADLMAMTIDQAAAEVGPRDFGEVIESRRAWRGPALLTMAAMVPVALAAVAPDELNFWARRALLLENINRPRQVRFVWREPLDESPVRRRGDHLALRVELEPGSVVPDIVEVVGTGGPAPAANTEARPWFSDDTVLAVLEATGEAGQRAASVGTDSRQRSSPTAEPPVAFRGVLRNLQSDATLTVRGGDGQLGPLVVRVVDAVECRDMTLNCQVPSYISDKPLNLTWGRPLSVPSGTRMALRGQATKPLSGVELRVAAEQGPAVVFDGLQPADSPEPGLKSFRLPSGAIEGDAFTVNLTVTGSVAIEVVLRDTDGLTNFHSGDVISRPIRLEIDVREDRPPVARLKLTGISDAITPVARLPLSVWLGDDHGLRSARLLALRPPDGEVLSRDPNAKPTELKPDRPLVSASKTYGSGVRELEWPDVVWEVGDLGLQPGWVIELGVAVEDFRPVGRDAAGQTLYQTGGLDERSRRTLQVVSAETLLARLLERLIVVRGELNSRIKTQTDLVGDLEGAAEADKADTLSDESYALVRKVSAGQQRLADDLVRLARGCADLIAEMDNNRVWTDGDDRRRKLVEFVTEANALLEERLNGLHGPDGPEGILALLGDGERFWKTWDANADGYLDRLEWRLCGELLERIDPRGDFAPEDALPGGKSLAGLFNELAGPNRAVSRQAASQAVLVRTLRIAYLRTAVACQLDAISRMRRMRRLLPSSDKFGAVIQGVRTLIDRQREAQRSTQKASDAVADDVFDELPPAPKR